MNGLGNESNLQDIGISFVIRIQSNYTPLLLVLLVASIIIIPPVIIRPSSAPVTSTKGKGCPNNSIRTTTYKLRYRKSTA